MEKTIAASVHQRLLNEAKKSGRPFVELMQYYAIERFMFRLAQSPFEENYTLKGALMFFAWNTKLPRPTKDVDLLGRIDNSLDVVINSMKRICQQKVVQDGIIFHQESISATRITEDLEYEGVRVRIQGNMGTIRLSLQIDIGFGDVIVPKANKFTYPTILGFPAPILRGYSKESTISEKFQAMVKLGLLNSRMKDFYDIWFLSQKFDFKGQTLSNALRKTFVNRNTDIVSNPVVFENSFASDKDKQKQWQAFIQRTRLSDTPKKFIEVINKLKLFISPVIFALAENIDFQKNWKAPGPWK